MTLSPTPWKLWDKREPAVVVDANNGEVLTLKNGHLEDGRRLVAAVNAQGVRRAGWGQPLPTP